MTTKTDRYTGVYTYDERDKVWLAHVAEIPEVHTYGRTLTKAQAHLREALALWTEVDEDELDLESQPALPKAVSQAVSAAKRSRVEAAEADARAMADTYDACRLLQKAGLSQRDIASQLGISHQRVNQLLDDSEGAVRKASAKRGGRSKSTGKIVHTKAARKKDVSTRAGRFSR